MKYLLFVLALSACATSDDLRDVDVPRSSGMISQQHSKWCWAAIVENLTGVPQCEVPAAVYPELSELDCCGAYTEACNVQGNVFVALDMAAGVPSVYERSALSEADLSAELAVGRQVVAHVRNETFRHVILITERTDAAYRVYDPALDQLHELSYDGIVNGFMVRGTAVTWQATTWKIGVNP